MRQTSDEAKFVMMGILLIPVIIVIVVILTVPSGDSDDVVTVLANNMTQIKM